MPQYDSSSDEGEGDDKEQTKMKSKEYEESMKYIDNFYNKCGMKDITNCINDD